MTYRTFIVPEEKNQKLLGRLWDNYGTKKAKIKEEGEKEMRLVYPTGIIVDVEVHAYISRNKTPSKVMIIGEMPAINHAKLNLETLIGGELQPEQPEI